MPSDETSTQILEPASPTSNESAETRVVSAQDVSPDPDQRIQAEGPPAGSMLNERFILEEVIGRGGMGIVYRARDLRKEEARDRDPFVAIKVLNAAFHDDPEAFIVLQRECKKAQRLAHPNIATVYDFDRDRAQHTVYMTMELLEGESVEQLLQRMSPGALPFREAWPLITGMGQGLSYAHDQGIVHSDFKPGNIFVLGTGVVKVLDFGIARAVTWPGEAPGETTTFSPKWDALTPSYASYEMFQKAPPDPRDDIFGLACVVYELLAGVHPFDRLPAIRARAEGRKPEPIAALSKSQNAALARGLAFDREQRTPGATEFLAELSASGTGGSKRALSWAAALTLVAAAAAAGIYLLILPSRLPPPSPAAPEVVTSPAPEVALDGATLAKIDRILEMADLHLAIGRVAEPIGSNAIEAYQAVLQLQPTNARAQASLAKIAGGFAVTAQHKLEQGQFDDALADVEQGLRYFPDHRPLKELQQQLGEQISR